MMNSRFRAFAIGAIAVVANLAWPVAWAQAVDPAAAPPTNPAAVPTVDPATGPPVNRAADPPTYPAGQTVFKRVLGDVESYYTAPLHWDTEQWAFFGGALGAVALSHHFDSNVRTHFVQGGSGIGGSTDDLQDALPAAALFAGTYIYASQWHDQSALTLTWAMAEAGGLSTVTSYALKYAIRRSGPNQTTSADQFGSGSSFPSEHAAAAFAVGTVFAESGSGGFRWVTRALGYGVAGFTAYERLKHNAHWLSDVVAGAALGGSTGLFVVDRTYGGPSTASNFSVVPMDGGLMLAFHKELP